MLVRWLGLQALSGLAASLPPTAARRATLAVLLLANATPLVALAAEEVRRVLLGVGVEPHVRASLRACGLVGREGGAHRCSSRPVT